MCIRDSKKTAYKQIEKSKSAIPSCSRYLARVYTSYVSVHVLTFLRRTALEKCYAIYNETQATIKHKRFRQRVFVLHPMKMKILCRKRLCLIVRCVGEYNSLKLFYFVNLTSNCSHTFSPVLRYGCKLCMIIVFVCENTCSN